MRIAKNDTVHANLLRFSKMPRFIGPPGFHCSGKAWSVLSRNLCKVSRFVGWLRMQIVEPPLLRGRTVSFGGMMNQSRFLACGDTDLAQPKGRDTASQPTSPGSRR
jgi:hypothetical protein